ncbi:MAG: hypothetical protein GY745_02685 [Actinomycetia bacterium]|nr:hypothetical protein [Actinomycetes bacterium]
MSNPYTTPTHREWQTVERSRLFGMDEWLLDETWPIIEPLLIGPVLDIGSGPGIALEARLRSRGIPRIALDRNHDYLMGLPAPVQGDITDLPMAPSAIPLLHARAVLGWLSDEHRDLAAQEILRVASHGVFVADFDWSALSDAGTVGRLKDLIIDTLEGFGFDPSFGARLPGVFEGKGWKFSTARIEPTARPGTEGVVQEAMEALMAGLRLFGQDARANEVGSTLEIFMRESRNDPDGYQLPAICVVSGPRQA